MNTSTYARRIVRDYAEQDARNRRLGLAGELAVIEMERDALISAGRADLAQLIFHVANVEGDGAGYDIKSYTADGEEKFIEVKTTSGDENTAFYLSSNEVRLAADHPDKCYLYRVFDFDQFTGFGKFFVHRGTLDTGFTLSPIHFKAVPAGR